MDSSAAEIANRFINEHGIDARFSETLTQMINDQICKIKASASQPEEGPYE